MRVPRGSAEDVTGGAMKGLCKMMQFIETFKVIQCNDRVEFFSSKLHPVVVYAMGHSIHTVCWANCYVILCCTT